MGNRGTIVTIADHHPASLLAMPNNLWHLVPLRQAIVSRIEIMQPSSERADFIGQPGVQFGGLLRHRCRQVFLLLNVTPHLTFLARIEPVQRPLGLGCRVLPKQLVVTNTN